jgi:3D (Asp-Asp-Asp) domain-containing protein
MDAAAVACSLAGWLGGSILAVDVDSKRAGRWLPWDVVVTAYCPCEKCCGRFADGRTASGIAAEGKIIAADKWVPFGTLLRVPGYGLATVQDRGRAIKGDRLDVFYKTHAEAKRFGRRKLTVFVWVPDGYTAPQWLIARIRGAADRPPARPRPQHQKSSTPDEPKEKPTPQPVAPRKPEMRQPAPEPEDEDAGRWRLYQRRPDLFHVMERWRRLRRAADERELSGMMLRLYRNGYLHVPSDIRLYADLRFVEGLTLVVDVQ